VQSPVQDRVSHRREGRLLNSVQHLLYRVLLQKDWRTQGHIDVDNYRVKQQDGMMTRVEKMVRR
jgi:predicted RNA-binding protein Jag